MESMHATPRREPWNKGKLIGQKAPLKLKDIWAIRVCLQMQERVRELALLDIGIDSKLRMIVLTVQTLVSVTETSVVARAARMRRNRY